MFDFENSKGVFPAVHRSYRFCLLTLGENTTTQIELSYFLRRSAELDDLNRRIKISNEELKLFSPNTLAPPILINKQDADLAKRTYLRFGVFVNRATQTNWWEASVQRMLSHSDPGDITRKMDEVPAEDWENNAWVRVYTGKAIHSFNHRFAIWERGKWRDCIGEELGKPDFIIQTEYYARQTEVVKRLRDKPKNHWLIGYRDVCRATDERTTIAAIVPPEGCDSHCRNIYAKDLTAYPSTCLVSNFNSFSFDYYARQKIISTGMGAGLLEQLPVLPPATYDQTPSWTGGAPLREWIAERVLELTYTAYDLREWARDLGYEGEPFGWDVERRFALRCELDAAFFHLYGLSREEAAYVMDTFPIVRRKDEAAHGSYRTRDEILRVYERMAGGG